MNSPKPLNHIDLDNIGARFDDGTWSPRDVAALFVEIQRLNLRVDELEREKPAPTLRDGEGDVWSLVTVPQYELGAGSVGGPCTREQIDEEFGLWPTDGSGS